MVIKSRKGNKKAAKIVNCAIFLNYRGVEKVKSGSVCLAKENKKRPLTIRKRASYKA